MVLQQNGRNFKKYIKRASANAKTVILFASVIAKVQNEAGTKSKRAAK